MKTHLQNKRDTETNIYSWEDPCPVRRKSSFVLPKLYILDSLFALKRKHVNVDLHQLDELPRLQSFEVLRGHFLHKDD
jgi:hypothetical protein